MGVNGGPGTTYVAGPALAAACQAAPERHAAVEGLLGQMTQNRQRFLEGIDNIFDQLIIVLQR